jgi:hypothetical protein
MPFIGRTICAALWGVPGPVIVGILIPVACEMWRMPDELSYLSLFNRVAVLWPVPFAEGAIGLIYGLMRRFYTAFDGNWRRLEITEGTLIGGFVWFIIGLPFVALMLFCAILGSMFAHGIDVGLFGLITGVYLGHILGGAIAGFHVEYYLLRGRG